MVRMPTLDIVIVNWNSGEQLKQCLLSIDSADCTEFSLRGVVVVDNGSTDASMAAIFESAEVTLIRAGVNLGFAKACNLGASKLRSEFLLFLNPDARVFRDSLAMSLRFMQRPENSQVGIVGVQLLDEFGEISRHCTRFPNAGNFIAHSVGLDRIDPTLYHFMSEWNHATTRKVDHVIGAFFLVRRSVYDALGGFDERFFVYLEDLDFSYRAMQLGWSSAYIAEAQAFHAGGGSSRQVKAKALFYSIRSRLLYSYKHLSFFGATMVLFASLFVEPLTRLAVAGSHFSGTSIREIWIAYGMVFRWLPRWLFRGATR
jgi:GT2 family glycosyltransferase